MNVEKLSGVCKQLFALACVNAFAFVYDGQFVPLAIGLDCLILGVDIRGMWKTEEKTKV